MTKVNGSPDWARLANFCLENAGDMIFCVHPDGSFVYTNSAVRNGLGYTREEMRGLRVTDILADYDNDSREDLRATIDRAGRHVVRATLRRKDGTTFPVEAVNNAVILDGVSYNCAFSRDISRQLAWERYQRQETESLRRENDRLRRKYALSDELNIIGTSRALLTVLDRARSFARAEGPVLITGESGVGKESIAHFVHRQGERADRPLCSVNCATWAGDLILSKLFGHVKGAFTGATQDQAGLFEVANGGTLFLDEVGELSLEVQAMLLRVVQFGEFRRLGCQRLRKTDVRLIAATNRNLATAVAAGTFRSDLRFRLDTFPLNVPALRDRATDIPCLVRYRLEQLNRTKGYGKKMPTGKHLQRLQAYAFPGNVRELFSMVQRSYYTSPGPELEFRLTDFAEPAQDLTAAGEILPYADMERAHIRRAIRACDGQIGGKNGAAALLGLKRSTLISRMRRLGMG